MIHVVDDDELVRQSIAQLVASVGLEAKTYDSARTFLDHLPPEVRGCVIVDMRMPGMSGIELQEQLAEQGIDVPVIVMSAFGDVSSAVRAMKAGAVDFLQKPVDDQVLLDTIHQAIEQDQRSRTERDRQHLLERRLESLTAREREVFALVVQGLLNKQVAAELGTSEKTIKVHRARVMQKMEADSLADLVRMGTRLGIPGPTD